MGAVCGSNKGSGSYESTSVKMLDVIENGDDKRLKKLIRKGADVNDPSYSGYTALMHAASNGQLPCIERLLYAGADVNISTYHGSTALLEAVVNGHTDCVMRLISSGAAVNARDGQRALYHVIINGNVRFLNLLIKSGANVNEPYRQGKTPLTTAVEKKQSDCATLLVEAGADTKCLDYICHTGADVNTSLPQMKKPLHVDFCDEGVDRIKGNNARNNVNSSSNLNILYSRASNAHVNKIDLPKIEADVTGQHSSSSADNSSDQIEKSSVNVKLDGVDGERLTKKEQNVNCFTKEEKRVLSCNGHIETNVIVVEAGEITSGVEEAVVNRQPSFSKTRLFVAVNNNDMKTTRSLIESGSDVNVSGPNGRTPLMMAAYSENNICLELLLEAGADVNAVDKACGYTALMFAVKTDNYLAVKSLLNTGADVNTVNNEGKTALDIARAEKHDQCVEILTDVESDGLSLDHNNLKTLLPNSNLKDLCRESIRNHLQQMSSAEFMVQVQRLGLAPLLRSYLLHYEDERPSSPQNQEMVREKSPSRETVSSYSSFAPDLMEKSW